MKMERPVNQTVSLQPPLKSAPRQNEWIKLQRWPLITATVRVRNQLIFRYNDS